MAKITRDQVNKINKECKNGFGLDLERLVIWGEKQLAKEIRLENGNILRVILYFKDIIERYEKKGVQPVYSFSMLEKTSVESMYRVHTLKSDYVGELIPRRNMKQLQELTALDIFADSEMLAKYAA